MPTEIENVKCAMSHLHGGKASTRFCPSCGKIIRKDLEGMPRCDSYHSERQGHGHKFCVDCGAQF